MSEDFLIMIPIQSREDHQMHFHDLQVENNWSISLIKIWGPCSRSKQKTEFNPEQEYVEW